MAIGCKFFLQNSTSKLIQHNLSYTLTTIWKKLKITHAYTMSILNNKSSHLSCDAREQKIWIQVRK